MMPNSQISSIYNIYQCRETKNHKESPPLHVLSKNQITPHHIKTPLPHPPSAHLCERRQYLVRKHLANSKSYTALNIAQIFAVVYTTHSYIEIRSNLHKHTTQITQLYIPPSTISKPVVKISI